MSAETKILNERNSGKNGQKNFGICRKCKKVMQTKSSSCRCRPCLCHRCCECGMDCDFCGCNHKERMND